VVKKKKTGNFYFSKQLTPFIIVLF
jgi:hypothetical protein